ncbi:MAG: folate-binding protein [Pseudomonadota bacterium]
MSDWISFLSAQGAYRDTHSPIASTPPSLNFGSTFLIPLLQNGLLSVNGPDATKFLQGQITCDVYELKNAITRIGAQCNIKGRMLLCFRAMQIDNEHIILRMHRDLIATAMSSFGKYIVFSKAKLADINEEYRCVGIVGHKASQILSDILNFNLTIDDGWQLAGKSIVIRLNENRYECWLAASEAELIWQKLAPACEIAEQSLWTLLDIQAGLGDITPNTVEIFTPQAINLQLVNGINFRKGCYTGQEIVARLHYRGNLKRHMYRFEFAINGNDLPLPGSELHNHAGKSVGEVVIAAKKTAGSGELLASAIDDQLNELYIPNNPQKLSLLSLPYAIPTSDVAN